MKRAMISGINGQDGVFLSEQLLQHDVEVYGFGPQPTLAKHISERVYYFQGDLRNTNFILKKCDDYNIDIFFNLASLSSVADSFHEPNLTREINYFAPKKILDGFLSSNSNERKFFQASSSEMFGNTSIEPQDEHTPFNPLSPYAKWKAEMHAECEVARSKGLFVASGIMYNHESKFRPPGYLSKKVAKSVAELFVKNSGKLKLGNINAQRDWGFAGDYVNAICKIMDSTEPQTYVIATGKCHSVLDMVRVALRAVNLEGLEENFVILDSSLLRPAEPTKLVGNPSKANRLLGWTPTKNFSEFISDMVYYEIEQIGVSGN